MENKASFGLRLLAGLIDHFLLLLSSANLFMTLKID
jgi:hypothetical protein